MRRYPEFYVLRHGETEWNRAGRLQGHFDSPLTPLGLTHAACQRDILAGQGLTDLPVIASPQGRALRTAQIAAPECQVQTDPALVEISVGEWAGRLRSEIQASAPHLFSPDRPLGWYDHAPGGEGIAAIGRRCQGFLDRQTGPAILVTHGITSRVLRCLLMGLPVGDFDQIQGGQGVVFHLRDGIQTKLT